MAAAAAAAVAVLAAVAAVAAAVVAIAAATTALRLAEVVPGRGSASSSRRLPPGRSPQRPPPSAERGSVPGTCQRLLRGCYRFAGSSWRHFLLSSRTSVIGQIDFVQQLAARWKNRLLPSKSVNASTETALLPELKDMVTQTVLSFGSEQITSSFGLSTFPVNSSSNSASSFSYKTSPSPISASSGNTPAFGSSSAGVMSSTRVSRSVRFGNRKAPLAASFSFKTSEKNGAFGAPGFSGFGNSSAVNTSSATPLPTFGAFKAAVPASPSHSSNTLFGQKASASGCNITSVSSAVTNNMTSGKLFTPKSELSAEELKQFEAKRFTLGKIPLQPPPLELLNI